MKFAKFLIGLAVAAMLVAPALAQVNPTATLTGHVTDGKEALPGVTVTVTSPNLQGTRTAVTSVNGDYFFTFLPAGEYTVKFELQGFQTQETTLKLNAAQTQRLDASLPQAKVAEEVTVTGSYETISGTNQVASTLTNETLGKLPVSFSGGTIQTYAALAPGVNYSAVTGQYAISGALSYENLFLVNGVAIMDNVRNTPTNFYVEDAVQETTTSTASISAEYGRFSGGVVNMLTKSGGNDFHASLRLALDNDKWTAATPLTVSRSDKVNDTYAATLGGFILKDRLWFFGDYRYYKTLTTQQTSFTNVPYPYTQKDTRYEGKLTFSLNPNHRIVADYLNYDVLQANNWYSTIMDLRSLYNRDLPSTLATANYTGVITDNFFVEGQYSKKKFAFVGSGSLWTDPINGTLMLDRARGGRYWSPTFCGICEPELRNNQDYIAKASYFLSTKSAGSHDLVAGVDVFEDIRSVMNHQSGNDNRIYGQTALLGPNGVIYPVLLPGTSTYFLYEPILTYNHGNDYKTESLFLNDKWRLNNYFSFNIGVRYDKNHGVDGMGNLVASDSSISPRLAITWDPKGDGNLMVNAGYAKYVMAIANTVGDSTSSAGNPASWAYNYGGPAINNNCVAATGVGCTDTATAIAQFWAWFKANGVDPFASPGQAPAVNNTALYRYSPYIPGGNTKFSGPLDSPNTQEITVGAIKRFGTTGMVRLDYVNRKASDFYVAALDMTTGTTTTPNGKYNWTVYENNSNLLERSYNAIQLSWNFRAWTKLTIGGNWTMSELYGNWDGENTTSGPLTSGILSYPEYRQISWYAPKGDLGADQRHKARLWLVWDFLNTKHHSASVSLMESYFSGTPFGAVGTLPLSDASGKAYVTNPGYISPPTTQTYWFQNRDTYLTDNSKATSISLNYSFVIPALGSGLEFFLQPVVTNVFNEHTVTTKNATVYTAGDKTYLTRFNPFTDTPKECPQNSTTVGCGNWQKGPNFGLATTTGSYQAPRSFSVSLGVRF
jgi:hypothetical protein